MFSFMKKREGARPPLLATIKTISFAVLSLISISLSVYLFMQFSSDPIESILFASLAIAFEGSKLYALVDGHRDWVLKSFIPAVTKLSMYILLASLSVIASYGFSLGALQRANLDPAAARSSAREAAIERQISEIDAQIGNFQRQQTELPAGWVTSAQRLQESIDGLVTTRADLYDELFSIELPDFDLAENAFVLIGESVGMSGTQVMFILLIVIAFSIELCIVFTSPSIPHPDKGTPPPVKKPTMSQPKKKPAPKKKAPAKKKTTPAPKKEKKVEQEPEVKAAPVPVKKEEWENFASPSNDTTPKKIPEANKNAYAQLMDKYVSMLFDNEDHTYLRSPVEVRETFSKETSFAQSVGLHISSQRLKQLADSLWNSLLSTKGPTGYFLVEKAEEGDKEIYLPNYTSELVKSTLRKKIQGTPPKG